VRYEEARDDLRTHYETTGSRDLREANRRFNHLDAFFAERRLVNITGPVIAHYVSHRQRGKSSQRDGLP
jgi:hypothetical protein